MSWMDSDEFHRFLWRFAYGVIAVYALYFCVMMGIVWFLCGFWVFVEVTGAFLASMTLCTSMTLLIGSWERKT